MSRTGKLRDTLAEYEQEHFALVKEQLEQAAYGHIGCLESALIAYRAPIDATKKDRIEWLANQIAILLKKLHEPTNGTSLKVIKRFRRQWDELGTQQRRNSWIHLSRQALDELNAIYGDKRQPPFSQA